MRIILLSFLLCAATIACGEDKAEEKVLILHKGDPLPPVGVPYSYDSKETQSDFERRLGEHQVEVKKKEPEPKCSAGG